MNQGRQANKNGQMLENQIKERILSEKYKQVKGNVFLIHKDLYPNEKIFSHQCRICQSIYDTPYKTDFIIYDLDKHPTCLAFEIKWQSISGSVDQKYPYMVNNIKNKFPCPAIIVLDGNGYRPQAFEWLKNQIDNKLLGVFSIVDFFNWANGGNL